MTEINDKKKKNARNETNFAHDINNLHDFIYNDNAIV